jgi:hypothetical protein
MMREQAAVTAMQKAAEAATRAAQAGARARAAQAVRDRAETARLAEAKTRAQAGREAREWVEVARAAEAKAQAQASQEARERAEAAAAEERVFVDKVIALADLLHSRAVRLPVQSGFELFKQETRAELELADPRALEALSADTLNAEVLGQWRHVIGEEERSRYRARAAEMAALSRRAAASRPRRRRRGAQRGHTQGGATARPTSPLGEG